MDISRLPTELQCKILDHLSERDLENSYAVSQEWREMVRLYQTHHSTIKEAEWRWYCRHQPQQPRCTVCLEKSRARYRHRSVSDWDWWVVYEKE